jgi:hypothetical protein
VVATGPEPQGLTLLLGPLQPPQFGQLRLQHAGDVEQVGDVGGGVGLLVGGERPA